MVCASNAFPALAEPPDVEDVARHALGTPHGVVLINPVNCDLAPCSLSGSLQRIGICTCHGAVGSCESGSAH
jgi:hypothetical protein